MTTPQLKLFNALTREKKAFIPLDPSHIGLYVCGITPYDYAHIGNLRTMVVFDVLYRLLSHLYPKVTYVRNYTDIDDKIVERAQERGMEPFALAAEFIEIFERDMASMNLLEPSEKPRVSQYLKQIVTMVNGLLEKGFAYVTASGDVMFDVPAFEKIGTPHDKFGHLARRTFDNLQARVEGDDEKRDPRDFPIWKANAKSATKLEQAFVPKELGATFEGFIAPGRPGWHIECSVMSQQILNPNPQPHTALFDIHGGGEDLAFPHHSCEIAQTEAFNTTCTMSSVWMHAAFLTVEGQKMSKSLNNFVLVSDAVKKYSPEAIRLWLLQTHYRKPVDFSDEALQAAQQRAMRWQRISEEIMPDDLSSIELPEIRPPPRRTQSPRYRSQRYCRRPNLASPLKSKT
ncbi:MAG: cysteine--tRNA ligase [Alphaproteobacteria bacterium]|nr:MAG: cysteine--tRNA ligase [Alphaproteobacteria bacterium]